MRPTSVIFLIISILVACLGVMLCLGAMSMAEEEGIELFSTVKQEDGNYVINKYFGLGTDEQPDASSNKNDIKKMELVFENVDVLVKGGAEENKIEFVNFTDGMFSYKTNVGGALTVEDLNGISKIISFSSSGINFKGFRNLLFYYEYGKLERSVVVYIADDSNVNNITCSVKNGNIVVESLNRACDLTLTAEEGDIKVSDIKENSSLNISAGKGSVYVSNSELYDLTVKSEKASVEIDTTSVFKTLSVDVEDADVSYKHKGLTFDGYDVLVSALDGKLTMNGKALLVSEYKFDGAPDEDPNKDPDEKDEDKKDDETSSYIENVYVPNSITIKVEKGDIYVENVAIEEELPEDPSDEETEEGSEEE